MNDFERAAVLTELVDRLRQQGSWAGATHMQKVAYLLQEMLGVPLGLRFRLYKYGPFSSALRDELEEMEAYGFIAAEPQRPPYGPRLRTAVAADSLRGRFGEGLGQYREQIDFIVNQMARLGVEDLEKIATAYYVTAEKGGGTIDDRAARLHEIKPHVSLSDAKLAVRHIDAIKADAPRV